MGAGCGGTGEGWTPWPVPAATAPAVKAKSAGSALDMIETPCPGNAHRSLGSRCEKMAGPKAPLANIPTPKRPSKAALGGFLPAPDVVGRGEAEPEPGAAGEGPLGLRPVGAPDPFEPARLRSVATTVEATPVMLLPGTAPVAAEVTPVRTPVSSVEPATVATAPVVLVTMDEPAVVTPDVARVRTEVTLELVWARSCETVRATPEVTLEPAWATVWVMLETLAAPLTALLTVRVTTAVAVGVAEPASRVMFEALFVVCVTAPVTVAAALASVCAGEGLAPGAGPAPLGAWLALRAEPVVAAPTLFTVSVVGAAALVTVVAAAGGEAGGACAAGAAGVVDVTCAAVAVVACAAEEISCAAVPATLPSAPVTGAAALDSSASARVPGSAHRAATIINRAIRRSAVHAEGL